MEPVSLENLNNCSCYMNAVIQSLRCLPEFVERLQRHTAVEECSDKCCYRCKLADAFDGNNEPLFEYVDEIIPNGCQVEQQDAEEFFLGLLRKIRQEDLVLGDMFKSTWIQTTTCEQCGFENKLSDYTPITSLPCVDSTDGSLVSNIPKGLGIMDRSETIDFRCSRCGFSSAKQSRKLAGKSSGKYMAIHLKRYAFDSFSRTIQRLAHDIHAPIKLMGQMGKEIVRYSLKSIVLHSGHSTRSGHYTSVVKYGCNWFYVNDDNYDSTYMSRQFDGDSYIVFYEQDNDEFPTTLENVGEVEIQHRWIWNQVACKQKKKKCESMVRMSNKKRRVERSKGTNLKCKLCMFTSHSKSGMIDHQVDKHLNEYMEEIENDSEADTSPSKNSPEYIDISTSDEEDLSSTSPSKNSPEYIDISTSSDEEDLSSKPPRIIVSAENSESDELPSYENIMRHSSEKDTCDQIQVEPIMISSDDECHAHSHTIKYLNEDRCLPVFSSEKEISVSDVCEALLEQHDRICSKVPYRCQENMHFIVSLNEVPESDLKCDGNGVFKNRGTTKKFVKKSTTSDYVFCDEQAADFILKTTYWNHKKYPDFGKKIRFIVDKSGNILNSRASIQYRFSGEPHIIEVAPHGNARNNKPYSRVKPSVVDKVKDNMLGQSQSEAVSSIISSQNGILGITSLADIPKRSQAYKISQKHRNVTHGKKDDEIYHVLELSKTIYRTPHSARDAKPDNKMQGETIRYTCKIIGGNSKVSFQEKRKGSEQWLTVPDDQLRRTNDKQNHVELVELRFRADFKLHNGSSFRCLINESPTDPEPNQFDLIVVKRTGK
ncbi:uncharacterized protein LOC141911244 [Tubulanus polymorphus]|uniref:uncharacterized protein LOC141911244 n=1 Tax=Tubulanus polymorphus TaxID=672921 RepID=UPI003DA3B4D4